MASGKAEASIDRTPERRVEPRPRLRRASPTTCPASTVCTVDGDVRTVGTMGIEVKEQLRELDDDTRRISYSVIESPMSNMVSHLATISVDAEGSGTHLTWEVEVEPDELCPVFQGVYEQSVVALEEEARELIAYSSTMRAHPGRRAELARVAARARRRGRGRRAGHARVRHARGGRRPRHRRVVRAVRRRSRARSAQGVAGWSPPHAEARAARGRRLIPPAHARPRNRPPRPVASSTWATARPIAGS